MKKNFYFLFTLIFVFNSYSQTGIGAYSVHDGGFENHTSTLAGGSSSAANLSTSLWTANTTANVVRLSVATGGRSGSRYVTLGSTNGTAKNFYSPQLNGAFAPNTTYQIQFFYKSASTVALESSTVDIFVDNASATQTPPIGTKQSTAAGLSTSVANWTKVAVAITTDATPAGNFGVAGFTIDATTSGYSADIDDFVVYQSETPDNTAPNVPGAITAIGASSGGANVSWVAAAGGVDGGGYLVIRYASNVPSSSDDPIQNGIYKFANTVGSGIVRYIGSSTSFTDTNLTPGVDYYYKVYTVDKAFNYSNESVTTAPTQSLATTYYYKGTGLLTDLSSWGQNTNGTGTAPLNFTDASQVFEIRNTTNVTLDGVWTVGESPANGTKVRLGNASLSAISFTLNSGASIGPSGTGNFDVMLPSSGNQTIIYKSTSNLSLGTILDSNVELIYDAVTSSSATTKTFGKVSVINGAILTFTDTPVMKQLVVDATSTLVTPTVASAAFITILSGGAVEVNGTIRVPKLSGFVSSNVAVPADSFGALQFMGADALTLGPNSTVEFNRSSVGALNITPRSDYKNVTLLGTSPKIFTGSTTIAGTLTVNQTAPVTAVTLNGDIVVNGNLNFESGKIITSANNTLVIGASANIVDAGSTTGWVVGSLRKLTSSGANPSFNYTVGDNNNYLPVNVTFSSPTTTAGDLTVKMNEGEQPQVATSSIETTKNVNKYWTITNANLTGFGSFNVLLNYANVDIDSGAIPANFIARRFDGANWASTTLSGSPTDSNATISGLTSFGEFAIGELSSLSVSDIDFKSLLLYPNPVKNGVLNINSSIDSEINLTLFDLTGKMILNSSIFNNQVDVQSVKSGVYFAKIRSGKKETVQKIIIEN
jgi:trimeric autotransporter adhesin